MRALLALAIATLAGGCKDRAPTPPPSTGSAASIIDWKACDAALAKAGAAKLDERPKIIIDGCHVCGDWTPILYSNQLQANGGPTQAEIEAAMLRCQAFCIGDAKLKFLGALDDARGTSSRTPWRQLGEICKDKVSAVPDGRFLGPTYFALDRIARAAFAHGGDTAMLAGEVVLPLPLLSVVGTGITLPTFERPEREASDLILSYIAGDIYVGHLPTAQLTANGIQPSPAATLFPGKKIAASDLRDAIKAEVAGANPLVITLVAPPAIPSAPLVPIIETASALGVVHMGVADPESPEGWKLLGSIPVDVDTSPRAMKLGDKTVQDLVRLAGTMYSAGGKRLGVAQ